LKNKEKKQVWYVCGTTLSEGVDKHYVEAYSSVAQLLKYSTCAKKCGVVKLEMVPEWIQAPEPFKSTKKKEAIE
jgi:hypothetical protein